MNYLKKTMFFIPIIILIFVFAEAVFCQGNYKTDAEEANVYNLTRTTKTVENLNFNVQEDRPIEKVAGTYRPLDIDAYVVMKFNQVDKKVTELRKNVTYQFNEVAGRFDLLTKKIDELTEKVAALEQKQETLMQNQEALAQNQTVAVVPEAPALAEEK